MRGDLSDQGFSGVLYHIETSMEMHAGQNSVVCIEDSTCLPIGGHSVLGLYPSLNHQRAPGTILVMASMDTAGFFLDSVTVE